MGCWSLSQTYHGLRSLYLHSEREKVRFKELERERQEGAAVEKKEKTQKP